MSLFSSLFSLFFVGSFLGWLGELIFNRVAFKKWINPGFFVGPCVPIYGFGLCLSTLIVMITKSYAQSSFVSILLICLTMTLIELVGGLIFKKLGIMIWDYSGYFLNYKGVICPLFSSLWFVSGAIFYYFFSENTINLFHYFRSHSELSIFIGIILGIFILDIVYSYGLLFRLIKYAKANNLEINFEEFKKYIKEHQEKRREKYSFIFAFKQNISLEEILKAYKKIKKQRK